MQHLAPAPAPAPARTPSPLCRRDEFADWLQLIRSEYAEMPGLHLSKRQAQRLWGLDAECCQALLDALEAARYLKRTANDAYTRADIGCC
jgi:hypothetical protein